MSEETKPHQFNINKDFTLKLENDKLSLNLDNHKINFIYANNGVGKTLLTKYLSNKYNNDFYILKFDNTDSNLEQNTIIVAKNIAKINNLNNRNYEIENIIIKKIFTYLKDNDYSSGSKFIKNNFSPYVSKNNNLFWINELFKSKSILKSFDEYKNQLELNLHNDLYTWYISLMNFSYKYDKNEAVEMNNIKYNDLINLIKKIIHNVNDIIKNQLCEIADEENIDIVILEKIFNIIKNLDNMKNCYICESKIENFELIKEKIQGKIKNIDPNHLKVLETKNDIEMLDSLLLTNIAKNIELNKWSDIEKELKLGFNKYLYNLNKVINDLKNIFKSSNMDEYINNLKEIKNLNIEKDLAVLKESDLLFSINLINNIIGENRIDWSNIQQNKIILPKENGEILLSSGEISIICLIINLIYFVSDANNKNKFLILDDIGDTIDKLNRSNIEYIIKLFHNEYKLKFLIFSHDYRLCYELLNEKYQYFKFQILYKNINEERNIKNIEINPNSIPFLTFKNTLMQIFNIIKSYFLPNTKIEWNKDLIIIFLVACFLGRINKYIWKSEKDYQDFFEILKYEFLFENINEDKHRAQFDESLYNLFDILDSTYTEPYYDYKNKTNISEKYFNYSEFRTILDKMIQNCHNIDCQLLEIKNILPIKTNIDNLVKFIILREQIRYFLITNCMKNNFSGDKDKYREQIYFLKDKNIIDDNEKRYLNYTQTILNNFLHVENELSLILHGIEFNEAFVKKFIDQVYKIIHKN